MPHTPLTRIQQNILEYIREQLETEGTSPTIREIGERFGFRSTGTVRDHLRALERKGYLERQQGRSRGIVLAPEVRGNHIPILGRVAAGVPILSEENLEGYLDLGQFISPILNRDEYFALQVQGDSMMGAGIHEGDHVVVHSQKTAEPGGIVVALVDGEATVKRLHKEGSTYVLLPENPAYDPIPVTEDSHILGRVVTLIRSYGT